MPITSLVPILSAHLNVGEDSLVAGVVTNSECVMANQNAAFNNDVIVANNG